MIVLIEIGICEDDVSEREYIKDLVYQYSIDKNIVCKIDSFSTGQELLKENKLYDILFLDVNMPEMDGIELGKKIREKNKVAKIIYITAYANYSFSAFHVHAFEYLIKPVAKEFFYEKFTEIINYIEIEEKKVKLYFKKDKSFLTLKADEIFYFEAVPSHRVRIVTNSNVFDIRGTIDQTYCQVENYEFYKCHKSYIVNLLHIIKVEGYTIYLDNQMSLPLAERSAKTFKTEFNLFLQKKIERELME